MLQSGALRHTQTSVCVGAYISDTTYEIVGGERMAKIVFERDKCIGCGACAALNPDDWKMDGDKSTLIGGKKEGSVFVKEGDAEKNKDVAQACPVSCINVK